MRPDKISYYLNIAVDIAKRGTCLRRNYGSVLVKDDQIIGTGYTGAPRGRENCCDIGTCLRQELKIPSGERYELCHSVHSEMNTIINAGREKCIGSCLYLAGIEMSDNSIIGVEPCNLCKRVIINAGIQRVYIPAPNAERSWDLINPRDWEV